LIQVFLHRLASIALCYKQRYVTLHARHNSDAAVDIKTFWRPFLLFLWGKKRNCMLKLLVF